MKALCVPKITDTMNGRYLDIAIQQNSFLKELDLADDGIGSGEIDVLIGANLYWVFVDGNIKKNDSSGLAALSSKFGWLVSGPVPRINPDKGFKSNTMITTHVLFSQSLSEAETTVNDEIKKFWELDSVGIRDDEITIYDNHREGIELKNGRYEVGLPLKGNYPAVEDNFEKCNKRLLLLKENLNKKPKILN